MTKELMEKRALKRYKELCSILKMNNGSLLGHKDFYYFIICKDESNFNLPEDCELIGYHVCEKSTGDIIAEVSFV